jgi:hypothetical protein
MNNTAQITLLEACEDRQLFGQWFRDKATWQAWFAFIAALFALPMSPEQLAIYQRHTQRTAIPALPITESYLICGRRAGKSFVLALVAVYLACFRTYTDYLGPGERATIIIIAADRKQARQIFRYIRALIANTPMLAGMLDGQPRADGLDLNNNVSIEIGTASFRTSRGYSFAAVLADETAFWPTDDAAEPDYAVLDALRPGMANIPGAVLLCASSPYARRGALHDAFKRWFGKDEADILVWKAATREMNPTIPQSVIDRATERDPASAAAEYGAEFRTDVESFVNREAVEACVSVGVRERPPISDVTYSAFVDPSGGSADSMTLAIGHQEDNVAVLDAIRERRPPFSPENVVLDYAVVLETYHVTSVRGDRYAGEWPRERFREHGISYEPAAKPKSDLYRDLLPAINSRMVDLLEDARLFAQIVGLWVSGPDDDEDGPPMIRTPRGTGRIDSRH